MKSLVIIVDTYAAPTQPYIAEFIHQIQNMINNTIVISISKPVIDDKNIIFLKRRLKYGDISWAVKYFLLHRKKMLFDNHLKITTKIKKIAQLRPILLLDTAIIHVIHSQMTPIISGLCTPDRYDYIVTFNGYDTFIRPFNDVLWKKQLSELYSYSKALVFVSDPMRKFAIEKLSASESKSYVNPGCVNVVNDYILLNKNHSICKFITVGRLTWEKGFAYTLLAIKDLVTIANDKYPFEYHIIGDGDERKQINYLIRYFHLEEFVKLHGFMENEKTKEFVSQCDVYIQFSCSEASPLTLKEAGIMGLPLLGTSVGGIPEIIIDNYTGSLVEFGDIQGMTNTMYSYLVNTNLRKERGQNAHEYCFKHFSLSSEIARWLSIYNNIEQDIKDERER